MSSNSIETISLSRSTGTLKDFWKASNAPSQLLHQKSFLFSQKTKGGISFSLLKCEVFQNLHPRWQSRRYEVSGHDVMSSRHAIGAWGGMGWGNPASALIAQFLAAWQGKQMSSNLIWRKTLEGNRKGKASRLTVVSRKGLSISHHGSTTVNHTSSLPWLSTV